MRTKSDIEMIVTDHIINGNEYILVSLQKCRMDEPEEVEGDEDKKDWSLITTRSS